MISKKARHKIRQIPSWQARDRRWVASLALEPEQLEHLGHLKFEEGKDDLASLRYAFLELEPGPQIMLLKYANPYEPGTMVWVPAELRDASSGLNGLLDALGLSKKDLLAKAS